MAYAEEPRGVVSSIVRLFMTGKASVLLLIFALALGAASILITAREEEPQIVVPLADIFVQVPGASAEEVEKLAATPLERLLWQIDGVEHVYSTSQRDLAVATVRFHVGEDREESLVKLHNIIMMNIDLVPSTVRGWVVKPVEIDDVPIVTLTLYSDRHTDHELRRIGEEVYHRLAEIEDLSRVTIVGGRPREVRVELTPERMAGLGVSPMEIDEALKGADSSVTAGALDQRNRRLRITADSFLFSADEVAGLVVGVFEGRPVYLRDVAVVTDGPQEASLYSRIGFSLRSIQGSGQESGGEARASYPAVTLALAKKKGTNAVDVAEAIVAKVRALQAGFLPDGVRTEVTRNYGRTAQAKVDELLSSLFFAVLTVVLLLALTLAGAKPWWWPWPCPSAFPSPSSLIISSATPSTGLRSSPLSFPWAWWWMTPSPTWITSSATSWRVSAAPCRLPSTPSRRCSRR